MNVNDFKYYITRCHTATGEREIIATFRYELDRDYALDNLRETYPDAEPEAEDEE